MQEIQDLIPLYRELQDLYQSEAFKPLAQFLSDTKNQVYATLLQLDWKKESSKVEAAIYTTQLNMLAVIQGLPAVVKQLKDQFEANELRAKNAAAAALDPIYKGDYK